MKKNDTKEYRNPWSFYSYGSTGIISVSEHTGKISWNTTKIKISGSIITELRI